MKKQSAHWRVITLIAFTFAVFWMLVGQSSGKARESSQSTRRQCTSFVLDNDRSAVFGANFDYGSDISEGLIFVNKRNISKSYWESDSPVNHARWTAKYGSVKGDRRLFLIIHLVSDKIG